MLYLLLADGSHVELPDAFTAAIEGEELVCRGCDGQALTRYGLLDVSAYGQHAAFRLSAFPQEPTIMAPDVPTVPTQWELAS